MEKIIKIEDLVFEYSQEEGKPPVLAIDQVNLEIERGCFIAIIGKNGSGKSTLAKNLNALLLPSGGAVYINGYNTCDESKLWEIRQTAGMVFQNPDNQLVSSIVEDDVAFGPENLGVPPLEIRERVHDALEAVRMLDARKKAPHLLSGGQKQRIAIAGVIAMKPQCIILDEPTAMLDPSGRREVMEVTKRLHRDGITIVLITHFMDEAALADRIVIMENGKAVMDGTPQEVFAKADEIRALNLDVPIAVDIAEQLRSRGLKIPLDIIETEDLVNYLCQYK